MYVVQICYFTHFYSDNNIIFKLFDQSWMFVYNYLFPQRINSWLNCPPLARITSNQDSQHGLRPWTQQSRGCGQQGDYISMAHHTLRQNTSAANGESGDWIGLLIVWVTVTTSKWWVLKLLDCSIVWLIVMIARERLVSTLLDCPIVWLIVMIPRELIVSHRICR